MKTRLITGVLMAAALALVVYAAPPYVTQAAICVVCAVAAYELLHPAQISPAVPVLVLSCAAALVTPVIILHVRPHGFFVLTYAYVVALFVIAILAGGKITFAQVCMSLVAALIVPALLSSVARILFSGENGKLLVLLPCIAAWGCDTFAHLVGSAFGRHKLAPAISPKKSVEGLIGGMAAGALGMAAYGFVLRAHGVELGTPALLLAGAVGALVGQCGDLSMSLVKRSFGVKDFGKLFPGHGGMLDRFDSLMFTAPLFEILLVFAGVMATA